MRQIAQLLVLFALFTAGCLRKGSDVERGPAAKVEVSRDAASREGGRTAGPRKESSVMSKKFVKPPEDELRRRLSPLEYEVTQHDGTEPPFQNRFHDHKAEGLYVDVVSGEPLFSSRDKFDSGTGWPSFTRPVDPERVTTKTDRKLFMARTEVRSKGADSHLGHVFDDGPAPSGKRYCINSAALRFVPVERLEAEGYAEYEPLFEAAGKSPAANSVSAGASAQNACDPTDGEKVAGCSPTLETAILAGGCFWGMEDILRKVPGVLETEVGYAGGTTSSPNYEQVKTGRTGHAESIRIVFDPKRISYAELLEKWFFRMHDPTTKNRQGNDVGTQYRSAIFATSDEQRKVAEHVKAKLQESGKWRAPIVTEIVSAGPFTPAEDYHQDYLEKHPGGYTCHYIRD